MRRILLTLLLFSALPVWALRVVSLLPSNTEIIEALGAGDEIVGVTLFDRDYAVKGRASVGDFLNPSLEAIVGLKPDVIVAGAASSSRTVPRLQAMGYRIVEIANPRSVEEIYGSIRRLAEALGRPESAEPVIARLQAGFDRLRQERQGRVPLRGYIEIDLPFWTVGSGEFLSDALRRIGLENIFSDLKSRAGQVSAEVILRRNPQVILSFVAKKETIVRRPGWGAVEAVRAGHIIDDVSDDLLTRPSPRLLEGIQAVSERLKGWGL
jgi:iron complex transport system substrate-binding protein